MTEHRNALAEIFGTAWKDDAFKARFMSDPKGVLAEKGIEMPDGMNVEVVENTDNMVHITLPAAPADPNAVSDAELSAASGGGACQSFNAQIHQFDSACG